MRTIRYYSDLGILPPAEVRASGIRLYSDADRVRLGLVRALREIGVDLASIGRLLDAQASVGETLALQLEAVEVGIRTLQRQRAVLRAALARPGGDAFAYLDRLRRLARLDAVERRALLSQYLDRALEGIPVSARWEEDFRRVAIFDVPEVLSDAQLDAWLELAQLVTDDDFVARMREIGRDFWEAVQPGAAGEEWLSEMRAIERDALRAGDEGINPGSADAGTIVDRYVRVSARVFGREVDEEFRRELVERIERNGDPRAQRYWELVAILKGWERPAELPTTRAYRWLFAALRRTRG